MVNQSCYYSDDPIIGMTLTLIALKLSCRILLLTLKHAESGGKETGLFITSHNLLAPQEYNE